MREIALISGKPLFRKPIFIGYAEKKEPLAAEIFHKWSVHR